MNMTQLSYLTLSDFLLITHLQANKIDEPTNAFLFFLKFRICIFTIQDLHFRDRGQKEMWR